MGTGYPGGVQGLLENLQSVMTAEDELRVSDYLPAHYLHAPRGLQQIIALPEFHAGQLQVISLC